MMGSVRRPAVPVRKLAWVAFPFAAGCFAVAQGLSLPISRILAVIFALAGALSLLLHPGWRIRLVLCLFGFALGLGWTAGYTARAQAPVKAAAGETITVSGVVLTQPEAVNYRERVELQTEAFGKAYLYLEPDFELALGDIIICEVTVSEPSQSQRAKGIQAILGAETAEVTGTSRSLRLWPAQAAQHIQQELHRLYSGDVAGLFRALLTGDKSELPISLTTALARCGLSHIVAVSGG